jgi:hypothetical protein
MHVKRATNGYIYIYNLQEFDVGAKQEAVLTHTHTHTHTHTTHTHTHNTHTHTHTHTSIGILVRVQHALLATDMLY